ncbi:MAG: hypothetical protein OEQ39_12510 [Gammaproteobacteria bacterium]|nr:hypothetical protein [Gammaproteobacteria bacterium]MDH3465453.1 hypothetical protein [Gammaproteobacteria bacterium]
MHNTAASSTTFVVDAGRLLWMVFLFCLIFEVGLVYLDLTVNWQRGSDSGPIRRLFNITREDGLASWFAVTQTVLVALTLWSVFAITCKQGASALRRIGWLFLALLFTFMAIDDGALIHERLGSAFQQSQGIGLFPSYAWQMVVAPFFVIAGILMALFLWRELPRPVDRWRVTAALGCLAVAVAMDFVEGMDDGYRWLIDAFGWGNEVIRHFSKAIEEFIEMLAMSILLITFLGYIANASGAIALQFVSSARSAASD